MISVTPSSRASSVINVSETTLPVIAKCTPSATVSNAMPALSGCCIANFTGLPETRPCSLPKAITEPVKVIAPMMAPADSSPINTALS